MAAIAVLAVAFVVLAAVPTVADDSDATTAPSAPTAIMTVDEFKGGASNLTSDVTVTLDKTLDADLTIGRNSEVTKDITVYLKATSTLVDADKHTLAVMGANKLTVTDGITLVVSEERAGVGGDVSNGGYGKNTFDSTELVIENGAKVYFEQIANGKGQFFYGGSITVTGGELIMHCNGISPNTLALTNGAQMNWESVADSSSKSIVAHPTATVGTSASVDENSSITIADGARMQMSGSAIFNLCGSFKGEYHIFNTTEGNLTIGDKGSFDGKILVRSYPANDKDTTPYSSCYVEAKLSGGVGGAKVAMSSDYAMTISGAIDGDADGIKKLSMDGTGVATVGAENDIKVTDLAVNGNLDLYAKIVGTMAGTGTVTILSGSDVAGATITTSNVVRSDDDTGMSTAGVNGSIDTPYFGPKQILTIDGEATVVKGTTVTVMGKLVVPEGSKLTIEAGAELILDNLAPADIEGTIVIEAADDTSPNGKLTVTAGAVTIGASQAIDGDITINAKGNAKGSLELKQDVTLTMNDTSVLSTAGVPITVSQSAVLELFGAFDGAEISNAGTVVINSEVPATSRSTIKMTADGAAVDVQKYTISGSATDAKLTITDEGNVLYTYKDKTTKQDADVTFASEHDEVVLSATFSGDNDKKADYSVSITGVKVVEQITTKAWSGSGEYHGDTDAGLYNKKQYYQSMDVCGSVDGAYTYIGDATASDSAKVTATLELTATADSKHSSIVISGELSVGSDAIVDSKGVTKVTGTVTAAPEDNKSIFKATAGRVTVDGEGKIVITGQHFSDEQKIDASKYVTEAAVSSKKVKTYTYTTIDSALAAAKDAGLKEIVVLGKQTVTADAEVPAGTTVNVSTSGAALSIGKAVGGKSTVLTVANGGALKGNNDVTVNGTLYALNKSDIKNASYVKSDVYSEQTNEAGEPVKNGWAKWTNLTTALDGASAGETITVSKTDLVVISENLVVKDGVTLVLPDKTAGIKLKDGVTLTVDGTVVVEGSADIYAETGFDLTAQKVEDKKYSSAVVVNGALKTDAEIKYDSGTTNSTSGAENGKALSVAGAPIAGAYYQTEDYFVITTLEKALADAENVIVEQITIHGKVVAGDVKAVGNDTLVSIVVSADAAVTKVDDTTNGKIIGTSLTVGSLTLDGVSLIVEGTSSTASGSEASPAYFTGSVVVGDASVEFKHSTGAAASADKVNAIVSIDEGKLILGEVALKDKGDSFAVTAGTVYLGASEVDTGITVGSDNTTGSVKVAEGATLVANTSRANVSKLSVDGTLSVPANKGLTVTGTLQVNGTVKVDASTSTSAQGNLAVEKLFVGISSKDYYSTGAAASFSGPATLNGQAIVSADAVVDDAFKVVLDAIKAKTTFNVNGAAWFTAYFNGTVANDGKNDDITVNKIPVQNVELLGWAKTDGGEAVDEKFAVSIGDNANLYALINTEIYTVVIKADEGIANVYLNGQAMYYGAVNYGSDFYYAYTATVAAGDYKVTYTLKNGWSGDAKLSGDNVSGMSLSVSGDAGKKVYQLTGIEKSGYVEPVEPSEEKDDGMTITDYLLIILVVLIVVLAIIVAMRLMRS